MKYTEKELQAMCNGFEEALLWSSANCDDEGNILEEDLRGRDLWSQSSKSIITACADFLDNLPEHIGDAMRECYAGREWGAFESIGHDFLLTRNRHGVGFWGRDFIPSILGDALSDYARAWGDCYATLGSDDIVYTDNVASRDNVFTVEWPTADAIEEGTE